MNILELRTSGGFRSMVAGITVLGMLAMSGCGRSKNDASQPQKKASDKPSAIAQPPVEETPAPETAASPEMSPGPEATPSPEATPTPDTITTAATTPKVLYVAKAFEAVSDVGTHEFPKGAKVNVLEADGTDYVIEYHGVAVRNGREFFSETPLEDATPEPTATPEEAAAPTPDTITTVAGPDATPDPSLTQEEEKSSKLLGEIRTINEEIRKTEQAEIQGGASHDEAAESPKVKKLKKRRDSLSEDLTDFAKP